jgi:hypothetical protein
MKWHVFSMFFAMAFVNACGTNGKGNAVIYVQAEDSIPNGVQAGTDEENIQDGWSLSYDTFLITLGDFKAASSQNTFKDTQSYVVDLKSLPSSGLVLSQFNDIPAERYTSFGYSVLKASSASQKTTGLSEEHYNTMVNGGYSVWIKGTFSHNTLGAYTFTWALDAATSFDDCASEEGDVGFAVPEGGTVNVKPTVHGDHWVFSSITRGSEAQVKRLAQWVSLCDQDGNRDVTLEELRATRASDVFPSTDYNLSGSFNTVETAYDYLIEQARTLGDFQGEGECPTRKVLH